MIKAIKTLSVFVSLLAIDQFVKYIIRHKGGFYICNNGVAFGWEIAGLLLNIFWVFFLVVVFFYIGGLFGSEKIRSSKIYRWLGAEFFGGYYFTLIVAGAFSNQIDRILVGCVVDFIDPKIWPVFNLADMFIFLGAVGLSINIIKRK